MTVVREPKCQVRTNKLALLVMLVIACLLALPSLSLAQLRWRYCLLVSPSSYPLRWGEWVNLLRYSCWWGRFTNNLDDTAQAITFGVFFQRPGFAYPKDTASHWLSGTTFMLKALLDEWNAGRWTDGNCVDVSCLTMLALCSVGLDFSTRQLTGSLLPTPPACGRSDCPPPWQDPTGITEHFHTNDICPIGSDPTLDWTYKWWAWHQVCVLTGAPEVGARIWDPTAAQKEDLNGNGYRNPPADHPNHRWPQEDYWQKPRVWGAQLGLVNEPTLR